MKQLYQNNLINKLAWDNMIVGSKDAGVIVALFTVKKKQFKSRKK